LSDGKQGFRFMCTPNSNSSTAPGSAEPQSLWQTVRQFPRPVWVLFLGTFINKFGTFVVPFLALHVTRLGYSAGQAGLALAAYGTGHLTASLLGGHLADSIGRRKTIVFSMFTGAASILLLSQAQTLAGIVMLAYLTGLTAEFYKPASGALLADLVGPENRVTAYAAYRFAINAGWALGPMAGGLLARHSYFWLFAGDAATAFLFGCVALAWLPQDRQQGTAGWSIMQSAWGSVAGGVKAAAADARFRRLLFATLAIGFVFVQMPTTLGLEIKGAGHSEAIYGIILGLNGAIVVLCEIPLSAWTRRLPPPRIIAVGFMLIGCGTGLNALADQPLEYAAAMAVMTVGEILSMSVSMAYAASLAPEALRGRYMGLYGLTWALALTAGPAAGLWTFARHPTLLWGACAILGVMAAAIVAGMETRVARPRAEPAWVP
jgi:MFS family permease